jgi:hypothetical protein
MSMACAYDILAYGEDGGALPGIVEAASTRWTASTA